MKELIATFDWIEGKFDTRRKLANYCLKAFEKLQGYPQGTLRNPSELASSVMDDGRYLIQAIYEDGEVLYNDGWNIVEEVGRYYSYKSYVRNRIF